MRVLCLHGKGTSAAIFEAQTAAVRRELHASCPDTSFTFEFVDGPLPAKPAPPVDHFSNGPFYSFYDSPGQQELNTAHAWLERLIAEQGPYDGVLAFSQGCALIATLLIKLQMKTLIPDPKRQTQTGQTQPFKFAIFVCGGIPLSFLAGQGYHVSDAAWQHDKQSGKALTAQASFTALLQDGSERWNHQGWSNSDGRNGCDVFTNRWDGCPPDTKVFGLDLAQVAEEHKIQILTVHIYGSRDPRMGSALQLAGFCSSDKARVACHEGGHDIPRTTSVSKMIAGLMTRVSGEVKNDEKN